VYLLVWNKPYTESHCNVNDVEVASLSKVGIASLFPGDGKVGEAYNFWRAPVKERMRIFISTLLVALSHVFRLQDVFRDIVLPHNCLTKGT